MTTQPKDFKWLNVPAQQAARRLLGCELLSEIDGQVVRARIVETEAYDQVDEASHTFKGRTKRNEIMYKSAGHLYVYFTYGMHYCCNVVCGGEESGEAVLIRAVEPLEGHEIIENRRKMTGVHMTNGPGKACQALAIGLQHNGHILSEPPIKILKRPALNDTRITIGTRVGISKAVHELRRFYINDNPYVSKK